VRADWRKTRDFGPHPLPLSQRARGVLNWPLNAVVLATLYVGVLFGCSRGEPARPTTSPQSAIEAPPAPPPPPSAAEKKTVSASPSAAKIAPPSPAPPTTETSKTVQKKAAVGVGEKGRYEMGITTTPVATYWLIRERIAYEIEIPQAMKLFQANEDRLPKSHKEFMERIIKENHINLPVLPEGHRYVYDPKRGELMVEQPAQQ
jgi:hypothetical protein